MADRSPVRPERAQPSLRSVPQPRPAGRERPVSVPEGFRNPLAPIVNGSPPALLPLIRVEDDIPESLERSLHPLAVRAQGGDWAARDALYTAFEPKLMRFARRVRVPFAPAGAHGVWERDDVNQEAYLVFTSVVANWPPAIPFGRYVLAHFPWRLRDAINRGVGKRTVPPRTIGVSIELGEALLDRSTAGQEQRAMLEALASSLEPPLDNVFRLHILDGLTLKETGSRIGISQRTVTRHWRTVLLRLRPQLVAPM